MGGSSIMIAKGEGSATTPDELWYFKPDTGGRAYVIVIRPSTYKSYDRWKIKVTGTDYEFNDGGTDVAAPLHRVALTGLVTNRTYTIVISWVEGDISHNATLKRTYYCTNTSPDEHPYSSADGTTTVPAYESGYPYFCVDVKCSDNESKADGRCRYDWETRNLFWSVCAANVEGHPICGPMSFYGVCRWPPGTVYVSVKYKNTTNKSIIEKRINEWISWMNGLVSFAGVEFKLGTSTATDARQINVIVGTHEQLWGYNPDEAESETVVWGGYWERLAWGDGIIEARVKICCEDRHPFNWGDKPFEGIVFEELTEASGPGYDQFGLDDTLFSEIHYPGKTVGGPPGGDPTRDENVIRILYGMGYLKGIVYSDTKQDSVYDSGIKFTKGYANYGPLSPGSYDLFFQINATEGPITKYYDYTLPAEMFPGYKSGRTYELRAIYATEAADTEKEQTSGLSFRYTNPSTKGSPYFSLPSKPSFSSSKRIDGGYNFSVSGLSVSGEYYQVRAYLKDVTDENIDDLTYFEAKAASYSAKDIAMRSLKRGRCYDFYLYATYIYSTAQSDWVYIGEGTVAPAVPTLSNISRAEGSLTFTYTVSNSEVDTVYCTLYRGDTAVARYDSSLASEKVTLSFEDGNGDYTLRVHSVVKAGGTEVACVDSDGNKAYAEFNFSIENREYFYWENYTTELKAGGDISKISHTVWNAFVQNIYDVVMKKDAEDRYMPGNTSAYASGFGLAGVAYFPEALLTYAKMAGDSEAEKTLSAERFNIVNYIINSYVATGLSYKTRKWSKVYASELITLQDKLNLI